MLYQAVKQQQQIVRSSNSTEENNKKIEEKGQSSRKKDKLNKGKTIDNKRIPSYAGNQYSATDVLPVAQNLSGLVSRTASPVLGSEDAADISTDTTGWTEHISNDEWWNGEEYISFSTDTTYLHFLKPYFKAISSYPPYTGADGPFDHYSCFISNYPLMMFNGAYDFYLLDLFVGDPETYPSSPPTLVFGSEFFWVDNPGPGIDLTRLNTRVLYREELLKLDRKGAKREAVRIRYEATLPGHASPDIITEITFVLEEPGLDLWVEIRIGKTFLTNGRTAVIDQTGPLTLSGSTANSSCVLVKSQATDTWKTLPKYHIAESEIKPPS